MNIIKKMIYIVIPLIFISCGKQYSIYPSCGEIIDGPVFENMKYNELIDWIDSCQDIDELKRFTYLEDSFRSEYFYHLSKKDLELWKEYFSYLKEKEHDFHIWEVDKVELYYIFKDLYGYSDEYIEKELSVIIDDQYKHYDLELKRLILWQNLLVWWDCDAPNCDGYIPNYITNDELKYLYDTIQLDVSREVIMVSSIDDVYTSIDEEGKIIFINMLEYIKQHAPSWDVEEITKWYLEKFRK